MLRNRSPDAAKGLRGHADIAGNDVQRYPSDQFGFMPQQVPVALFSPQGLKKLHPFFQLDEVVLKNLSLETFVENLVLTYIV